MLLGKNYKVIYAFEVEQFITLNNCNALICRKVVSLNINTRVVVRF